MGDEAAAAAGAGPSSGKRPAGEAPDENVKRARRAGTQPVAAPPTGERPPAAHAAPGVPDRPPERPKPGARLQAFEIGPPAELLPPQAQPRKAHNGQSLTSSDAPLAQPPTSASSAALPAASSSPKALPKSSLKSLAPPSAPPAAPPSAPPPAPPSASLTPIPPSLLSTVNRSVLDFDFEKLCSVTLSPQRPFACLCCGHFFQGRGRRTPAHAHALESGHELFMSLSDERVFRLPEGVELSGAALADVRRFLRPRYSAAAVAAANFARHRARALDGGEYLPGAVGLNNLKNSSCFNALIQSLTRVRPLRDTALLAAVPRDPLFAAYAELTRRLFSSENFKGIVSPHVFIQGVSSASGKAFAVGREHDPLQLLVFLLHRFHVACRRLGPLPEEVEEKYKWAAADAGAADGRSPAAGSAAAARVAAEGRSPAAAAATAAAAADGRGSAGAAAPAAPSAAPAASSIIHRCFRGELEAVDGGAVTPFMYISLPLPKAPLFRNQTEKIGIPQVPIFGLLDQFVQAPRGKSPACKFRKLPPYLIIHLDRFAKNNFFVEKNPTIVTVPIKSLDFAQYTVPGTAGSTKYNLVASISHQGPPQAGHHIAHILNAGEWLEMNDLRVTPQLPQLVGLSEAYVQIWQRSDLPL